MNCFTLDVTKEGPCGPRFIFLLLIQCVPGYCHLHVGEGYFMELRVICDGQFLQSDLCPFDNVTESVSYISQTGLPAQQYIILRLRLSHRNLIWGLE